jgi:hypothetical protein
LNLELDYGDGSLYIQFVRDGTGNIGWEGKFDPKGNQLKQIEEIKETRKKGYQISYHTSGRINYKKRKSHFIINEPLYFISKSVVFAVYSIPQIEKLDVLDDTIRNNDYVVEFDANSHSRLNFSVIIAPWNEIIPSSHIAIRYSNFFSLNIIVDNQSHFVSDKLKDTFILLSPEKGLFKSPLHDKDTGLILFHQKINNRREVVIYSPNKEGIWKIIFVVPMCFPPKISISFVDNTYSIEILTETKAFASFKVRDKYGNFCSVEIPLKNEMYRRPKDLRYSVSLL